jgi:hypothetical protein
MKKCIKCGNDAHFRIRPDIDIEGIAVCEDCKDEVFVDAQLALINLEYLKRFNKKYGLSR